MIKILPLLVFLLPSTLEASAERLLVPVETCEGYEHALTVSFLNVGQGDSILIQCPDGKTQALLDAGDSDQRYPSAASLFQQAFLKRMGADRRLEIAINTHPHQDHLYGFLKILEENRIKIGQYIDNGADDSTSSIEERIRQLSRIRAASYRRLRKSEHFELCPKSGGREGVEILLFPPPQQWRSKLDCPAALNDCSIVSRLDYKGVSFLFLADALYRWESLAVSTSEGQALLKGVDVLKLGHHGSGSTSTELLETAAPAAVVLSTGKAGLGTTNKYRFPERSVIQRLISYFSNSGPKVSAQEPKDSGTTKTQAKRTLPACKTKGSSACKWESLHVPYNVWSTAEAGTIEMRVKNKRICVESELLTEKLEFRL